MLDELLRAIEDARIDRGLSYRQVGRAIGVTGEQTGRILRGQSRDVSVIRLAELLEVVGLELGARAFAGSGPLRDAGHFALLERFCARLPPSVGWRREVPVVSVAGSADRRAWDGLATGAGWSLGVEAETHVRDAQAVERRVALKRRDGNVTNVLLLLTDSRWHRDLVRASEELRRSFPVPARAALRELRHGRPPGGDALLLL